MALHQSQTPLACTQGGGVSGLGNDSEYAGGPVGTGISEGEEISGLLSPAVGEDLVVLRCVEAVVASVVLIPPISETDLSTYLCCLYVVYMYHKYIICY